MKIAFVISSMNSVSGRSNGVTMQAVTWLEGLRDLGHDVVAINSWGDYDWKTFDIIQLFGVSSDIKNIFLTLKKRCNARFVFSPIIDTERAWYMSRLAGKIKIPMLHLTSPWGDILDIAAERPFFLARSNYEREYIHKACNVGLEYIYTVPLGYRNFPPQGNNFSGSRTDSCLHVSILSGARKNVVRLINAAIKYKFNLILAGSCGDDNFKCYLNEVISKNNNIQYVGKVSDEKLFELYSSVKCFALPSLFEGVGLVALEAAACGCDIVLTDRGAPKEYYNGLAYLVDPLSVDDIGRAILKILNGASKQPALTKHIIDCYSPNVLAKKLEDVYSEICNRNKWD